MKLPEFVIETVSVISGAKAASDAGDPSAGHAISEFVNNRLHVLVNQCSSQIEPIAGTDHFLKPSANAGQT